MPAPRNEPRGFSIGWVSERWFVPVEFQKLRLAEYPREIEEYVWEIAPELESLVSHRGSNFA